MSAAACCSTPAVTSNYSPIGRNGNVAGIATYETGPETSDNVIVCLYDIFGHSAQTKQGADIVAKAANTRVIIPDVFNGKGFDVKRMPEGELSDADEETRNQILKEFGAYFAPDFIAARLSDLRKVSAELRKSGAKKVGIYGLCWGGKIVMLLGNSDKTFDAVAQLHPAALSADDAKDLAVPIASFVSKDEPADQQKALEELVKSKPVAALSEFKSYTESHHGWAGARADLNNPVNARDYNDVYARLPAFFQKAFAA
ncbi:hypothetical protein HKX48_008403 [Thoreauomyces humboldtii]|nr:hypothetical protein HKX48_008403 [Thoreauomyces humboldtii]